MRNTRALRNLLAWLGVFALAIAAFGVRVGWDMQPAQLGMTFLVIDSVIWLIAFVLFAASAVLTGLLESSSRS